MWLINKCLNRLNSPIERKNNSDCIPRQNRPYAVIKQMTHLGQSVFQKPENKSTYSAAWGKCKEKKTQVLTSISHQVKMKRGTF